MEKFASIHERAARRQGGERVLAKMMPKPRSQAALRKLGDDFILAEMSRAVFRSGFVWRIVQYKWPSMEEALHGFDPVACAYQSDEDLEALTRDERVIRHYKKLLSVRDNAAFILDVERSHQGFGRFLAAWPAEDIVGLHLELKKRGSRLGGRTGQFFLRAVGKDTFCLTRDVVGALIRQGVVDKNPTSQRDLRAVQDAFNEWRAQSGKPLCQVSRTLACSIDG
ncbi:MAG: DNA-3-methyladenine glycosylase I [Gammaproteobacteria bacterium]|nr:DNA-3-methyladenine glycosylase I [Gammaproteobacteria bacterium]